VRSSRSERAGFLVQFTAAYRDGRPSRLNLGPQPFWAARAVRTDCYCGRPRAAVEILPEHGASLGDDRRVPHRPLADLPNDRVGIPGLGRPSWPAFAARGEHVPVVETEFVVVAA